MRFLKKKCQLLWLIQKVCFDKLKQLEIIPILTSAVNDKKASACFDKSKQLDIIHRWPEKGRAFTWVTVRINISEFSFGKLIFTDLFHLSPSSCWILESRSTPNHRFLSFIRAAITQIAWLSPLLTFKFHRKNPRRWEFLASLLSDVCTIHPLTSRTFNHPSS